jgi:glycosyltransferase involved in cell wall biosynthesis
VRVLHVNADPGIRPGASKGAWVHVQAMRDAFAELGAEVVAIDEPDPDRLSARLALAGPGQLIYERFALHADRAFRYAVATGTPYVLEANSPLDEEAAKHRAEKHRPVDLDAMRSQLAAATTVLCVSNEVASWAMDRGARRESVMVEGNAVDLARFHPGRRTADVRARLGIQDDFVLGFHGRLRPWHGFESIARCAAALARVDVPVHVLTLGRGDYAQVLGRSLPPTQFTCVPWVEHEEVGEWVAAFDALALAYPPDEPCYFSPLKLLEAMACAVVPVVPDLGGLAAAVAQGEAGHVYAAGDEASLVHALERLYRCPAEREALATRGVQLAAQNTWTAVAARLLERTLEGVT